MSGARALRREHGTTRGFGQHYRAGEQACEECQAASLKDQRERRAVRKAEQEARRARWRQADAEAAP